MSIDRRTLCLAVLLPLASLGLPAYCADAPDLCAGLPQDKGPHPMAPAPKPLKGQVFIDPQFKTRIIRITDAQRDFDARVAKPAYSTIPAWNADESLMILYVTEPTRGHMLYDGKTYRFIRRLDIKPADVEQFYWDPHDPDILWYIYNWEESGHSARRLIRYHVHSDRAEVVHEFGGCALPYGDQINGGSDPQYNSWDNQLWGLRCRRKYPENDIFSFRLSTQHESPRRTVQEVTAVACPSGHCLWAPTKDGSELIDPETMLPTKRLMLRGLEHGDLGLDAAGDDFFAAVQFDGPYTGTLSVENFRTGRVRLIIGPAAGYPYPPSGTHISAVAFRRPGWVAVSVTGDPAGQRTLNSELLLANVDTGKVCRVGHHRSAGSDGPNSYWAEPHVVISPSGTRLLFGSDWNSGKTVDTYVLELPSYGR
jgi:hypothetical protein